MSKHKTLSLSKLPYWSLLNGDCIQGVSLIELVEMYGTPLYVYDAKYIRNQLSKYQQHPRQPHIHYAVKANNNIGLLARLRQWGAGFDIVSQGELMRVLRAGAPAESVVFSGVAKTDAEICYALEQGIGRINIESVNELDQVAKFASALKVTVNISLRINPDIDAKTHPYISTGLKKNKFGIAIDSVMELYKTASTTPNLNIDGISCHIGSQIVTLSPFIAALDSMLVLANQLHDEGILIRHLDIGGGLGISTPQVPIVPDPKNLVNTLYNRLDNHYTLHLEPGRSIVGNGALLLTRVISQKVQYNRHFVMVDAAMNDYMRPTLYQTYPPICNLSNTASSDDHQVEVVGPVCESSDSFSSSVPLSAKNGDILALAGVGAYGMSMSSQYNSRLRPAEVIIEEGIPVLIRQRDTYDQLWENEIYD